MRPSTNHCTILPKKRKTRGRGSENAKNGIIMYLNDLLPVDCLFIHFFFALEKPNIRSFLVLGKAAEKSEEYDHLSVFMKVIT